MDVHILILAAGASKRMGDQIKQLLPWKGTTLIDHACQQALNSKAAKVTVVLGAYADKIKNGLPQECNKEIFNDWEKGMGNSLAYGMKTMLANYYPDKVLIMLADQPLINTDYLNAMMDEGNKHPIVATEYENNVGVPALFDQHFFAELQALQGDRGAGRIIKDHIQQVKKLVNKAAALDIDTPGDYRQISKN